MTPIRLTVFLLCALGAWAGDGKLGAPVTGAVREGISAASGKMVLVLPEKPEWLKEAAGELEGDAVVVVVPNAGGGKMLLVDEAGILRRTGPVPPTAAAAAEFVREWELGKDTFRNRCARCHGEDGKDTGYAYIRRLDGIGNRLSREQIREKLHPSVVGPDYITIRGQGFTARELEALVTFLAGL